MRRLILLALLGLNPIHAGDFARLLPPETKSIMAVEASRLRTNPRWPLLLHIAGRWRSFARQTSAAGFDPSTQLDELALIRVDGSAIELVILSGQFDESLVAHFDPSNYDRHELRYRGVRVFAPPPESLESEYYGLWTACIAGMVVIGPTKTVQAAIDTYLAADPQPAWFHAALTRVRGRYDAWLIQRQHMPVDPTLPKGLSIEWSGGIRLDTKPSAEGEVIVQTPLQAQAIARFLQSSIESLPAIEPGPLWKMAAENVRIAAAHREVRVTAEIDWETLLVLASEIYPF